MIEDVVSCTTGLSDFLDFACNSDFLWVQRVRKQCSNSAFNISVQSTSSDEVGAADPTTTITLRLSHTQSNKIFKNNNSLL